MGTAPFTVWFLSYVLPPPIYLAAYLWHQRRATPDHVTDPLPRRLRTVMLALGAFLTADSLFAFVHPSRFTTSFPWNLTPLTARALAGWRTSLA